MFCYFLLYSKVSQPYVHTYPLPFGPTSYSPLYPTPQGHHRVLSDTFSIFLPGEFHGQRSLAGYSPWGHKELDITEQLTLWISLSFPWSNSFTEVKAERKHHLKLKHNFNFLRNIAVSPSYLFYTQRSMYVNATLSIRLNFSFPLCVHMSVFCLWG